MTGNEERISIGVIFRDVIAEFKQCYSQCIMYEALFKLIAFLVLSPISVLIASYFLAFTGHPGIGNDQLLAFFLSAPGIASLILGGVAAFSILFIEQAGLIIIAFTSLAGNATGAARALVLAVRNIPALIGTAMAQFVIYVVCSLPFPCLAFLAYSSLLTKHDISFYLAHTPPVFWMAVAVGAVLLSGLAVVLSVLFIHWVFAVPVCLFEQQTLFNALKRSRELVRGSMRYLAGLLIAALVLFLGVSSAISFVLGILGYAATRSFGALLNQPGLVAAGVIVINIATTVAVSVVAFPLFNVLIAKLYFAVRYNTPDEIPEFLAHLDHGDSASPTRAWTAKLVPWITLGVILVSTAIVSVSISDDLRQEDSVEVTAHRGSSKKAPENTLSAIRQAIEDGADIAEIDVQETSDGVIVLLHDSDLMKVTGVNKKIWEATHEEIRKLDAGSWFSPAFKGEHIPTLEEAIKIAGDKIKLNIELKYNGHDKKLAERALEVIRETGFEQNCIITSLSYDGLVKVKELNDKIKTGYILVKSFGNVMDLQVDFFSVNSSLATWKFVSRVHERSKEVHVWTVNSPEQMEFFIDLRVDNVITDHPDVLVKILKERAAMSDAERVLRKLRNWLD
jgi:glycerophosphoryl diester phosphodiesterase